MWNKQTHKWIYKLSVSGRACETTSGPTGGRSREVEERGPDVVEGGEELEQGWGPEVGKKGGRGGGQVASRVVANCFHSLPC